MSAMSVEHTPALESFATNITMKWPLARVLPFVCGQSVFGFQHLMAITAFELGILVCHRMLSQRGHAFATKATIFAVEFLISGVLPYFMCPPYDGGFELQVAYAALELGILVTSQMISKATQC